MASKRDSTATLVGLFLFVGLAILAILILQFGKIQRSEVPQYSLYVSFTDATGILKGSDVRIGGAKVGTVAELPKLNETFDRVLVHIRVNEGIGVPRNAEITTTGAGLLGDKLIAIRVPEGTDPEKVGYFKTGETIEGISAGSLTSLQVKVEDLSEKASDAITDLQGGIARISAAIDEFEKVARSVNTTVDRFNTGVLNDETVGDFKVSMEKLRTTSTNLADASEKLGPTLDKGSKAMDNIDSTLAEIRGVFSELKPVTEKVKTSVDRIGDAAVSLDEGVDRLTTGDGLLPSLVNDRSLRDEFEALVGNLRRRGLLFYRDDSKLGAEEDEQAGPRRKRRTLFGN